MHAGSRSRINRHSRPTAPLSTLPPFSFPAKLRFIHNQILPIPDVALCAQPRILQERSSLVLLLMKLMKSMGILLEDVATGHLIRDSFPRAQLLIGPLESKLSLLSTVFQRIRGAQIFDRGFFFLSRYEFRVNVRTLYRSFATFTLLLLTSCH